MSTLRYFGTDGIRARVGEPPMRPDFLVQLGWAIGQVLTNGHKRRVLIGKDTRISGYLLESALEAGLAAAGVDAYLLGPMPTPAIAYLTKAMNFDAGVMLSASHNPFEDNGVKLFNQQGFKLSDALEETLEQTITLPMQMVTPSELGKAYRVEDALVRYLDFCKQTLPQNTDFEGLTVVVDCANGANYYLGPRLLEGLGANVIAIANKPDGLNINAGCGSTHPAHLQQAVIEHKADIGIAFDGDGDRLIMVDKEGQLHDGDSLLFILATSAQEQGTLQGGVVGTLMSNLGLELALAARHIPFMRSKVGDRYVLEKLLQQQWQLGGENSGHLLNLAWSTTGDALIAAIQILAIMQRKQTELRDLAKDLRLFPQCMVNVKRHCVIDETLQKKLDALIVDYQAQLGQQGRILLRPSGTEPLMRIMIEGENKEKIQAMTDALAKDVQSLLQQDNL